ncbi:hypothetical protein BH09ACT5_BH09ACT5_18790 [soil metagenome]
MSPTRAGLLDLTSPGARAVMWLYVITNAILAYWTVGGVREPWLVPLAFLLLGGLTLAATLDTGERISLPVTILAIIVGPLNAALLTWNLTYVGYNSWFIGTGTVSLFLVCLRGRIPLAWLGFALLAGVLLAWGATTPVGVGAVAFMLAKQALVLVVGSMFSVGLRRTARDIEHLTREASARAEAEAAGLAETAERVRRHAELVEAVGPLLERIASGAPISAEDRQEFAMAEAELRDSLRARGLRMPVVREAARAARRRGVDVVLLDDSGARAPGADEPRVELEAFAAIVAETLEHSQDGRVTARLLPPGRSLIGTVVADGSAYVSHDVARGA